jgi:predicted dinucleotide-utilizing enzyme
MKNKRIGIIGFGFIGRYIYEQIGAGQVPGLEVAFVWNRSGERISDLPPDIVLPDLADFAGREPDMLVEMAHPAISAQYGVSILSHCDYMMLSVTAMADHGVSEALLEAAERAGTSLFIPHGALVGVDSLREGTGNWEQVGITFRKHPDSLDFAATDIDPSTITAETIVFDGSVRDIARRFPRNVNTMATCALATLGFDDTHAVLIADPSLTTMSAEVVAVAKDGGRLETRKVEQAVGVSGTGMLASQLGSIRRAALGGPPGMSFV